MVLSATLAGRTAATIFDDVRLHDDAIKNALDRPRELLDALGDLGLHLRRSRSCARFGSSRSICSDDLIGRTRDNGLRRRRIEQV